MIKKIIKNKGFTLAELLMAIWVTSIILAAVAALSYALGSANDSVTNTSDIYSKIRFSTLRLNEIIKYSEAICINPDGSVRIDDSNSSQKYYIQYDANSNSLKLDSTLLIDNCSYVNFTTDQQSKKLNIFFGIVQNGTVQNYQITACRRCGQ